MKRIGIDVTSAITQGGGIGRYTRELVAALAKIDQTTKYQLFSAKWPAQLPVANPLPTQPNMQKTPSMLNERWLYRLWYRLRLPLPVQWQTGKIDLFHSPDFVLPPVSGNIPTLLTVHDLSFVHFPDSYPQKLVSYLNQVVPWSIGRASHILADSQATKDDLESIWEIPREKVTVLYSGVHERFAEVTDRKRITAVSHKYNLSHAPYLLTVGTVQPRKNYQRLIQAFVPVAQQFPHSLIIAGGKGWLYDAMLAEVAKQGLEGRVRFIGFVDDADLPTLYSGSTLFLFPSIYEGFGLPLLEAMGCGVPVLSSDRSSLPEVAGKAAVLLPPDDVNAWSEAIIDYLSNEAKRTALKAAGFKRISKFQWQESAKQLRQIYDKLLRDSH